MEIKNLTKVAEKIKEAVENNDHIIIYADSDLDGIGSAVILQETIKNLFNSKNKRNIIKTIYFPDRSKEGYGLNNKALKYLNKFLKLKRKTILILLDCGITSVDEIEKANEMGFRVIVIDHHKPLNKMPKAEVIVAPKQTGDKSDFKDLANVGIVLKLAKKILSRNISKHLENNFYEIAALGTISDMMPQIKDNKKIIEKGIDSFNKTFRPGLKVFKEIIAEKYSDKKSNKEIAQIIISVLNSGKINNHINEGYLLLVENNEKKAKNLAKKLIKRNEEKQEKIKEMFREIFLAESKQKDNLIIFIGRSSWEVPLLGAVASRVCGQFKKPTFIYSKKIKESTGAVRMPNKIDGVEAMKNCADLLETFGGHPAAAGFRLKNTNLKKFKNCLINYFTKNKLI